MAVAAYTTDLTPVLASADTGTWQEWASPWGQGGGPALETDYFIQGSGSQSQAVTKSGISSLYYTPTIPAIPADGAFTVWMNVVCANLLDTDANGGMRLVIGSASTQFRAWAVGGKNSYVYGGWVNLAANPAINGGTPDYTGPSGGGTTSYLGLGCAINMTAGASRGNYFNMDAIHLGRCEARFAGGTSTDADATFAGFAAANDATTARWGLLQAVPGGYLWKGLMTLGYGAAVQFTDSNCLVLVDRTPKVTANFNKIEIRNASSQVNWNGISFLTLTGNGGTIPNTASKGRFEVVDDCDVNIANCSFTGMDTFVFKASSEVLNCTFRNCGVITANGASFAGTKFEGYEGTADTSYLVWDTNTDPVAALANCKFTKGTAATHAITLGTTSPTSVHIPATCTFSGYGANTTTSAAIYVARTSGDVTIYSDDANVTYKSAGANVTVSASQPTLTIAANVSLYGAEVRIYDLNGTLPNLGTELGGIESVTGTTYPYTGAAGNTIWIQVMKDGYIEFGQSVVMPSANQTLTVTLQPEMNA